MPLETETTDIKNVLILTPNRHIDSRGFFYESYRADQLAQLGFNNPLLQDNQSLSTQAHTLRGFHFQTPPHAQDKLVRVTQGAVLDVVVDLREHSPTYGHHIMVKLTAENLKQLLLPAGVAHAFLTLVPHTTVSYKVSDYYAPEYDSGILWNDPDLGIDWPLPAGHPPILSPKDQHLPHFKNLPKNLFPYADYSF